MNLTIKFIIAISAIILLSYGFLLFQTSNLQNDLVMEQARQQARILYKQILLTRQWVSDHQGLFFFNQLLVRQTYDFLCLFFCGKIRSFKIAGIVLGQYGP